MRLLVPMVAAVGLALFGCSSGDGGTGGTGGDRSCTQHDECGEGEHCWYGIGCDRVGVCQVRPTTCQTGIGLSEACGCDGRTYTSATCAVMHTGGMAYEGSCDCLIDEHCRVPEEFCYKTKGCLLGGLCTGRPIACVIPPPSSQVCGCDNHTYDSACIAAISGVSVQYEGTCIEPCSDDGDCGTVGEYCDSDEGCDANGVCTARPISCVIPPPSSQVCGCDGHTYESACLAAIQSVRVASDGICP